MKGLIIKDFINIKNNFKTLGVVLLIFAYMAYQTHNPIQITSMAVILFGILVLTSIAYDEMSKWDIYALTMPLTKDTIVKSKYILLLVLTVIPLIITSLISYFFILPTSDMGVMEFLVADLASFSLILSMISISLPFVYKYGVAKSRLIMFVIMAIPAFIFTMAVKYLNLSEELVINILKITPLISIIIFFISMKASIGIYKKKEF